jgi:hypothetical protein
VVNRHQHATFDAAGRVVVGLWPGRPLDAGIGEQRRKAAARGVWQAACSRCLSCYQLPAARSVTPRCRCVPLQVYPAVKHDASLLIDLLKPIRWVRAPRHVAHRPCSAAVSCDPCPQLAGPVDWATGTVVQPADAKAQGVGGRLAAMWHWHADRSFGLWCMGCGAFGVVCRCCAGPMQPADAQRCFPLAAPQRQGPTGGPEDPGPHVLHRAGDADAGQGAVSRGGMG